MTSASWTPAPPQRQCQPCTACCEGWLWAQINEFTVKAGHPCPHSKNHGCDIYEQRPKVPCQTFVCAWRVEKSPLPHWMRPDECGAIVQLSVPWQKLLIMSAIPVGAEIPPHTLDWLMAYARNHQRPLIYFKRMVDNGEYTGLHRFGYGPPAFRKKVERLGLKGEHAILDMSGGQTTAWPGNDEVQNKSDANR